MSICRLVIITIFSGVSSEAKIPFEKKKKKKRSLSYCKQAILILSLYTVWRTVCFSVRAKERRKQWPGPALTHTSRNGAEQSPHRDVPGRSADSLSRARLCLFPGAAQALSASLTIWGPHNASRLVLR